MGKIVTSRNRYVIPFMYEVADEKFDASVARIVSTGKWSLCDMKSTEAEQDLYSIILNCFVMDDKQNNIGCALKYCGEGADIGEILTLNYSRFAGDFTVKVCEVGMYLFRSGVGFIYYEANIPEGTDTNDFVLFQNEFKELSYERFLNLNNKANRYTFELNSDRKTGILMGVWLDKLLSEISINHSYFADRIDPTNPANSIPDKALIYSYNVLDEAPDSGELYDTIFRIANGYNAKYKRKPGFEAEIVEPFDNAYYYATMGGMGYFAIPDEANQKFYEKTFKRKIMLDYFNLYILALYQSYTILYFTKEMESKLSADSEKYIQESEKTLQILQQVETKINVFLIKSVYSSVSHISHQNDYYEYLIKKLKVKENIDGLTIGLESLQKLQEIRERERKEEVEEREELERELSDDRLSIGLGILSVLALISAIADGDVVARLIAEFFGMNATETLIAKLVIIALIIVVALIAVSAILPSIIRNRKKRKEYRAYKKRSKLKKSK